MENINDFLEQAIKNCGYCVKFDELLDWAKINVIKEYAVLYHKSEVKKLNLHAVMNCSTCKHRKII
jgi:hypothetical protein